MAGGAGVVIAEVTDLETVSVGIEVISGGASGANSVLVEVGAEWISDLEI